MSVLSVLAAARPAPATRALLPRRRVLAGAGAGAVAGLLAACSGGTAARSAASASSASGAPANPAGGLVIGMSYTPNVQFAPFYLAQDAGAYAEGVTLRHHGAQEGLFDALLAGTEQLVVAGADEAVVAASGGSELVVVGGFYQAYPGCVIVPEDSAVQTPADLAGRTIGVPGHSGETTYALKVALRSAGLSEEDVDVQEIGYTQQAALVAGKVDAIMGFSNNDAVQIRLAGTPVRTLAPADDVPLVGASLVTTASVLDAQREAMTAACQASAQGMERFVADPDAAVAAATEFVPDLVDEAQAAAAREVAVATAALIQPEGFSGTVGSLDSARFPQMLTFLADQGLLSGPAPEVSAVCQPLV